MWLSLDPRNKDNTTVVGTWDERTVPRFFVYDRDRERSLLGFITKCLSGVRCQVSGVKGIVVVQGPGGFSTVRSAVVFAHAVAFASGVPLVAMKDTSGSPVSLFKKGVALIKKGKSVSAIEPVYGREPNITLKNQ